MNNNVSKRLLATIAIACPALAPAFASPQQSNPLVGAWTLVSVNDERADGQKVPLYGPSPNGYLTFSADGRYSLQLCSAERPRFAANDRTKGTPAEYQAAVLGCNPHWGRYAMSGSDINFKIDHAIFQNWENTEQKRAFTLVGDVLTYKVPNAPVTGVNPVVIWKRMK